MTNIERYVLLKQVLIRYAGPRVLEIINEMDTISQSLTINERALANNLSI